MTVAAPLADIACSLPLAGASQPVLAVGAWLKNTLCVTAAGKAFLSPRLGDLSTPEACAEHERTARALLDWLGEKPRVIAHDLHPDFHSSRVAAKLAAELEVPLLPVQHHHAHIAAVAAEHGCQTPLLGLALDGVGLGADGHLWGGELLRLDGAGFQRLGHLQPLPMAGGDRAAREPWRMAAAVLHQLGRGAEIPRRFAAEPAAVTVAMMLAQDFHCPITSSAGRLFDAAAGLLGLSSKMEFEAQAAMALESAAARYAAVRGLPPPLAHGWRLDAEHRLDLLPLLAVLADMREAEYGAALFHSTLVAALAQWVLRTAETTSLTTVVCAGGCFLNQLLVTGLRQQLAAAGLKVLTAHTLTPGDDAISLGQAWIALSTLPDNSLIKESLSCV